MSLLPHGVFGNGSTARVITPLPSRNYSGGGKIVTKLFRYSRPHDAAAWAAAATETNPRLLDILRRIDPRRQYFAYARDDIVALPTPLALLSPLQRAAVAACSEPHAAAVHSTDELRCVYFDELAPPSTAVLSRQARAHLLEALQLLHAAGVAHGDAHVKNVLFGADGLPRLIDFGCAVMGATREECDRDLAMLHEATERAPSVSKKRRGSGARAGAGDGGGTPRMALAYPPRSGGSGGSAAESDSPSKRTRQRRAAAEAGGTALRF